MRTIKKIFQLFSKTKKKLAEKQAENKEFLSSKCGRDFFQLLKVSTLKFEEVCGRELFKLSRVSTFKFEVCAIEVFKLLKVCQKEFFTNVTSFKSNFRFV